MFFKRLALVLGGVCVLSSSSGCGIHLGEHAAPNEVLTFSGKGYSCVGQIPEHIEKYLNDQMSEAQISEFMSCLQRAFTSFAQLTRGRDQSVYSPDEIRRFLQGYFLNGRKVSDKLMNEFMVIKQVLIGGDLDKVSRAELFTAVEVLEDIRKEALRMKPHMKILNPWLAVQQDPRDLGARLGEANEAFKQSIQVFATRLRKSKQVYPFANLETFMIEFRKFVGWEDHFKATHPVKDWVNFVRVFKDVTVASPRPEVIRELDWVPLLQSMSCWYLGFLEFEVGIKNRPVLEGVGLQNSLYLAQEFFALTEDAIGRQPTKTLRFEQITNLFSSLHNLGWLPAKLRVSSIDQTVRAMVTRVFGDSSTLPSDRRAEGLTLLSLANMKSEFYRWAYVQLNLDSRYRQPSGNDPKIEGNVPVLQSVVGFSPDIRAKLNDLKGSEWDEFLKIKSLMRPLFKDGLPRVFLVPQAELGNYGIQHGFYNLSAMNLVRSVVALIYHGYAEDDSARWLWTSGIKGPELQKCYEDIREFGVDVGFLDRRNTNAGSRAFVEGKLFTYSASGLHASAPGLASELSFVEGMEYISFLFSGGEMAENLYDRLLATCMHGPKDIKNIDKVSRQCAEQSMSPMIEEFMVNMPSLQNYLKNLEPGKRQDYGKLILQTVFGTNSNSEWLEHNEMSAATVILFYAEAVMTRFDSNQDGILTNNEFEAAYPVFTGFIQKVSKDSLNVTLTDGEARGAFIYILDKKSMPTKVNLLSIWSNQWLGAPALALDRYALAEVFKAIVGKLSAVGQPKPLTPVVLPADPCLGYDETTIDTCPAVLDLLKHD